MYGIEMSVFDLQLNSLRVIEICKNSIITQFFRSGRMITNGITNYTHFFNTTIFESSLSHDQQTNIPVSS